MRNWKTYLIILVGVLVVSACKKAGYQGKNYINGFVYITDTITTDWVNKPLPNAKVYLKRPEDTNDLYYLQTITDKDGYFYFEIFNEDNMYSLHVKEKVNDLSFSGTKQNIIKRRDQKITETFTFHLMPDSTNRGVVFTLVDSLMQKPIPNASIRVYNSLFLASIDDTFSASYKCTTNTKGRAYIMNQAPIRYYYNASIELDGIKYSSRLNSFRIDEKGPIVYEYKLLEP
jgi:hypothetical protein